MAEQYDIPAAARAAFDRDLAEAIEGLLAEAAQRDHLDVIEANVDMMNDLFARMERPELAASVATLAIRLHRSPTADAPVWQQTEGERYGLCAVCGRLARWWADPLAARWVHVQPWAVTGPAAHLAEVAA